MCLHVLFKTITYYKKSRKIGSSVNVKINSTMKTYIHNILINFFFKKKEGSSFLKILENNLYYHMMMNMQTHSFWMM